MTDTTKRPCRYDSDARLQKSERTLLFILASIEHKEGAGM